MIKRYLNLYMMKKEKCIGHLRNTGITDEVPVASFKGLKISLADFYKKNNEWLVKENEEDYQNK